MASSLVSERLDVVVLWRLAATPAPSPAMLHRAVRLFAHEVDDATVDASLARLVERGHAVDGAATDAGREVLRELGANASKWPSVADTFLPMLALGFGATVTKKLKDRWGAAVVARHFGLVPERPGGPPSQGAVADAIVWRRLGLDGKPPARGMPAAIRRRMLADLVGVDAPRWETQVDRLARRVMHVPRADFRALRHAIVHAWLTGREWTRAQAQVEPAPGFASAPPAAHAAAPSTPPPKERPAAAPAADALEDFARRVRAAASHARTGLFGDRKVLISALFRELGSEVGVSSLDAFKSSLVEANQRGLLHLHRADLPEALDATEVAASATPYQHTVFHFIERQESP